MSDRANASAPFPGSSGDDFAALTAWNESEPRVYLRALESERGGRGAGRFSFSTPLPASASIAIAASVLLVVCVGLLLVPALGKAGSSVAALKVARPPASSAVADAIRNEREYTELGSVPSREGASSESSQPALTVRHVVRKATIQLEAGDSRAVFSKAAMLVSEAHGEYIEESSITGEADRQQATLKLRVRSDRMSAVLQSLRDLGTVTEESHTGDDVTTQVVDIEARLRNERLIEAELLQLLDQRTDAPLKEILELRGSINEVRGNIERMTAQREHLGRLVSLATILVIINDIADTAPDGSIGERFVQSVADAWKNGVSGLIATVSFFIEVFVGGLPFWLVIFGGIVMLVQWRRRAARRAATEPAPVL